MSRKALRCVVEIEIHSVTSPRTWLLSPNDVYVSICLFGQIQKTVTTASLFPLIFYDRLKFEKVFYTAYEPGLVSNALEEISVHVDLMQISSDGNDARLLAWYNSTALQFLFPIPAYCPRYGLHDREVLMERSVLFPGVSPRLEFSTRTVIKETPSIEFDPWQDYLPMRSSRRSQQKKSVAVRSSPHHSRIRSHKAPLGAAHRCRSVSPTTCSRLKNVILEEDDASKPAFVVRKVPDHLIGRQPSGDHPSSCSRVNTAKKSVSADVFRCSCHVQSCTICQAFQRYLGKPYHHHSCVHLKHIPGCSGHSGHRDLLSCPVERENAFHVNDRNYYRVSGSKNTQTVSNIPKENREADSNRFVCDTRLRKSSWDTKKSRKSSNRRK